MVVDKYVSRCLDVGSTPTGSIIPLHSFAFLGKTLLNQRFLFLSLVFLGILLRKKDTTKESQTDPKTDLVLKKAIQKRIQHLLILEIIFLFYGRHGIRTHARCYTPTAFPTRPLKPLE